MPTEGDPEPKVALPLPSRRHTRSQGPAPAVPRSPERRQRAKPSAAPAATVSGVSTPELPIAGLVPLHILGEGRPASPILQEELSAAAQSQVPPVPPPSPVGEQTVPSGELPTSTLVGAAARAWFQTACVPSPLQVDFPAQLPLPSAGLCVAHPSPSLAEPSLCATDCDQVVSQPTTRHEESTRGCEEHTSEVVPLGSPAVVGSQPSALCAGAVIGSGIPATSVTPEQFWTPLGSVSSPQLSRRLPPGPPPSSSGGSDTPGSSVPSAGASTVSTGPQRPLWCEAVCTDCADSEEWDDMSSSHHKHPPVSRLTPAVMITFKAQVQHEARDLVIRLNKAPELFLPVLEQAVMSMFATGSEPADRYLKYVRPKLGKYCPGVKLTFTYGDAIPMEMTIDYRPPAAPRRGQQPASGPTTHSATSGTTVPTPPGSAAAVPAAAAAVDAAAAALAAEAGAPSAGSTAPAVTLADILLLRNLLQPAPAAPRSRRTTRSSSRRKHATTSSDSDSGGESDSADSAGSGTTRYTDATSFSVRCRPQERLTNEPVRLKFGAEVPVFAWVEQVYLRMLSKYLPSRDAEQVHAFEIRKFRQVNKDESLPAYFEEMQEGMSMSCPPKSEMDCLQITLSNLGRPLDSMVRNRLNRPVKDWTMAYLLKKALLVFDAAQTQSVCRHRAIFIVSHGEERDRAQAAGRDHRRHRVAVAAADPHTIAAITTEQPKGAAANHGGKPDFKGKGGAGKDKPTAGAGRSPRPPIPDGAPGSDRDAQGRKVCRHCRSPTHLQDNCVQYHQHKLRQLQSNPAAQTPPQPARINLMSSFLPADTGFDEELHGNALVLGDLDLPASHDFVIPSWGVCTWQGGVSSPVPVCVQVRAELDMQGCRGCMAAELGPQLSPPCVQERYCPDVVTVHETDPHCCMLVTDSPGPIRAATPLTNIADLLPEHNPDQEDAAGGPASNPTSPATEDRGTTPEPLMAPRAPSPPRAQGLPPPPPRRAQQAEHGELFTLQPTPEFLWPAGSDTFTADSKVSWFARQETAGALTHVLRYMLTLENLQPADIRHIMVQCHRALMRTDSWGLPPALAEELRRMGRPSQEFVEEVQKAAGPTVAAAVYLQKEQELQAVTQRFTVASVHYNRVKLERDAARQEAAAGKELQERHAHDVDALSAAVAALTKDRDTITEKVAKLHAAWEESLRQRQTLQEETLVLQTRLAEAREEVVAHLQQRVALQEALSRELAAHSEVAEKLHVAEMELIAWRGVAPVKAGGPTAALQRRALPDLGPPPSPDYTCLPEEEDVPQSNAARRPKSPGEQEVAGPQRPRVLEQHGCHSPGQGTPLRSARSMKRGRSPAGQVRTARRSRSRSPASASQHHFQLSPEERRSEPARDNGQCRSASRWGPVPVCADVVPQGPPERRAERRLTSPRHYEEPQTSSHRQGARVPDRRRQSPGPQAREAWPRTATSPNTRRPQRPWQRGEFQSPLPRRRLLAHGSDGCPLVAVLTLCSVSAGDAAPPHHAGQQVPVGFRLLPGPGAAVPAAGGEVVDPSTVAHPSTVLADQPAVVAAAAAQSHGPTRRKDDDLPAGLPASLRRYFLTLRDHGTDTAARQAAMQHLLRSRDVHPAVLEELRVAHMRSLPCIDTTTLEEWCMQWRDDNVPPRPIRAALILHAGLTLADSVSLTINDQQVLPGRTMSDRGCDTTCMSLRFAQEQNVQYTPCQRHVMTANGRSAPMVGYADLVLAVCWGTEAQVSKVFRIYVMDGLEPLCDLLVGTPFETSFNVKTAHWAQALLYVPFGHRKDRTTNKAIPMRSVKLSPAAEAARRAAVAMSQEVGQLPSPTMCCVSMYPEEEVTAGTAEPLLEELPRAPQPRLSMITVPAGPSAARDAVFDRLCAGQEPAQLVQEESGRVWCNMTACNECCATEPETEPARTPWADEAAVRFNIFPPAYSGADPVGGSCCAPQVLRTWRDRVAGLVPQWLTTCMTTVSSSAERAVTDTVGKVATYVDDLRYQAQGTRVQVTQAELRRRIAKDTGARHKTNTQKRRLRPGAPFARFRFGWNSLPALLLLWLVTAMCLAGTSIMVVATPLVATAAVAPVALQVGQQAVGWGSLLASSGLAIGATTSTVGAGWDPPLVDTFPGGIAHAMAAGIMDTVPEGESCTLMASGYQKDEHGGWVWGHHPDATPEQFARLQQAVRERKDAAFAYSMSDLPGYTGQQGAFEIKLENGGKPVYSRPRRYSPKEVEITDVKCGELRDAGLIERCEPAVHASCLVIVPKKDGSGNWTDARVCVDYRPINKVTVADRYGLHNPEDIVQGMLGCKFFSKLDLRSGFSQIPILPAERNKTAFWWGNQLWQHTRMPFGMKNAPAKFQRTMDYELETKGAYGFAKAFIDDVIIYSSTMEEHIQHVAHVLDILAGVGLRAHPDKSLFGAQCLEYLGHNVSAAGMSPTEAKVAAIRALRTPVNVSELRSVLGFMNYYRVYVPNFSQHAKPLTMLLGEKVPWHWGQAQQGAFETLKGLLCRPGIVLRRFDPHAETVLHTDWSKQGIGAVLGQIGPDKKEYMVACISRSLNVHEQNYSSYAGEMLACVWAMKSFRHYLHGTEFTVITDHQPLQWLMETEGLTGKHARWALSIQDLDFTIKHRPGLKHQNADVPSRFPQQTDVDITGARLDGAAVPTPEETTIAACWSCSGEATPEECPSTYLERQQSRCVSEVWHHFAVATATVGKADITAPGGEELLSGNLGCLGDDCEHVGFYDSPAAVSRIAKLRRLVGTWVSTADWAGARPPLARTLPLRREELSTTTQHPTVHSVNTTPVPEVQLKAAWDDGVVMVELFGGICAGLEAALRNGMGIRRYLYVDKSPVAQTAARYRVQQLHAKYPASFPLEASRDAFTTLPDDVYAITPQHLIAAGARRGDQWVLVAGWECQDLSPAGSGRGLQGARSATFYPLLQVLGTLQAMQAAKPPIYWLENAAAQFNHHSAQARRDYDVICGAIGDPVCIDAAQVGAGAHRLRDFWTNMADTGLLHHVLQTVRRPEGLTAQQALDSGCTVQRCQMVHPSPPYYKANTKGEPVVCLPTLVAYENTYSVRDGHLIIVDQSKPGPPVLRQPNPDERERLLGYETGATAAPGLTLLQRHELTGRCMDMRVMESLFGLAYALQCPDAVHGTVCAAQAQYALLQHYGNGARMVLANGFQPANDMMSKPVSAAHEGSSKRRHGLGYGTQHVCATSLQPAPSTELGGGDLGAPSPSEAEVQHCLGLCMESEGDIALHERHTILAAVAEATDANQPDVWNDTAVMLHMRTGAMPEGVEPAERYRIIRRAAAYTFKNEQLHRIMADGTTRMVPQPAERRQAVVAMHEQCGHYGRKRTASLLAAQFWWHGMHQSVKEVVRECPLCDRVRASFQPHQPTLQPLPIKGLFYRWGVDLFGPLPPSSKGNTYVLVAIEYFSKTVELVPIPGKHADHTAYAFAHHVLGRYGAPAEVVTDLGGEFQAAFHDLLERALVDHRTTSPNHPQANGLAERAVQTIKRALRKMLQEREDSTSWDVELPWVALGYRCSVQESTGFSPYELLYGVRPVVPPAVRERMEPPVEWDDSEAAAQAIIDRAAAMKSNAAVALGNLEAAQHRDTLRYAQVRSGAYRPKIHEFTAGDYVYLQRVKVSSTLQIKAMAPILRVVEARPSGVLLLQGRCGSFITVHATRCTPCHLPNVDPAMDLSLMKPRKDHPCQVCNLTNDHASMILCNACNEGWHRQCLTPPMRRVPRGVWVCPHCTESGVTTEEVQALENARTAAEAAHNIQQETKFLSRAQRLKLAEAKALDGRLIKKPFKDADGRVRMFIGRLSYMGPTGRGQHQYLVRYTDGDEETVKLHEVLAGMLMPPDTPVPEELTVAVAAVTSVSEGARQRVRTALQKYMPGQWAAKHVTRLAGCLPGGPGSMTAAGSPECVPTLKAEVDVLLQLVFSDKLGVCLDAWSGTGTIATVLHDQGHCRVVTNDINPATTAMHHEDALSEKFYESMRARYGVQSIICSPWFRMLDLAMPLALANCSVVTCLHVPGHFLYDAHPIRQAWLRDRHAEGRLAVLTGLPMGPLGRRCIWLLLFASASMKSLVLRPQARDSSLLFV